MAWKTDGDGGTRIDEVHVKLLDSSVVRGRRRAEVRRGGRLHRGGSLENRDGLNTRLVAV